MTLKSIRGKNKVKVSLKFFIQSCYCFYLWRMRSTQCNRLTINSLHLKFKLLEQDQPKNYFKFLQRQLEYSEEPPNDFITPRYPKAPIHLHSLKTLSKRIKYKKLLYVWRVLTYKRKLSIKLGMLYWRKKYLVKIFSFMEKLMRLKKTYELSQKNAIRYYYLILSKRVLHYLKEYLIRLKKQRSRRSLHRLKSKA